MNDAASEKSMKLADPSKQKQVVNHKMSDQNELKYSRVINSPSKTTDVNKFYMNLVQENCESFYLDPENEMSFWECNL